MVTTFGGGRGVRVGVALSGSELWAAREGGNSSPATVHLPVAPYSGDNGTWLGLNAALAKAKEALGVRDGAQIAVALLRPLVEVRPLELPPLPEADLLRLLSHNAARYFLGARGTQVVGALPFRTRSGNSTAVLAATAPARVVDALHDAAAAITCQVSSVVPAEGAWAAAAVELCPELRRSQGHVLVGESGRNVLIEIRGGHVAGVRLFRSGIEDEAAIMEAIPRGTEEGELGVQSFGFTEGHDLLAALAERGIRFQKPPGPWRDSAQVAELIAAEFAGRATGPRLWSDRSRTEHRKRAKRTTVATAAVAGLLFLASGAVRLWGVERNLRLVEQERAVIRTRVSATLAGRLSVEDANRELLALADARREAPHWAPVLAELSAHLPAHTYLTAFHARGDSLVVDGLASSASRAFEAMAGSPVLTDVRAPAPVRRQAQAGSPPMERFTIAAELRAGTQGPGAASRTGPAAASRGSR